MKTNLRKLLPFLSPIIISKQTYTVDFTLFLENLRMNTQSPYGDEKQVIRDRKMGRRNTPDVLVLHELNSIFILKSNRWHEVNLTNSLKRNFHFPATIIWIKNKQKRSLYVINYPGTMGTIILFATFIALLVSLFSLDDLGVIVVWLCMYFVIIFFQMNDHNDHNQLIKHIIKHSSSGSNEKR